MIESLSARKWVDTKADSRWKRTVMGFLDYIDSIQTNPRIMDKAQKMALLAGLRESLRKITHPHHTSTQGLHMVLDIVDLRLGELGYNVPECDVGWLV